jgi:cytochrome c-type biogenesis protein CcmH/NrfG
MKLLAWIGLSTTWVLLGCSARAVPPKAPPINKEGIICSFKNPATEALQRMAELDATDAWTDEECEDLAAHFLELSEGRGGLAALYDAGLARQRCGHVAAARDLYRQVLAQDPRAFRARAELVRLDLIEHPDAALDPRIAELARAVLDSQYQSAHVLVDLARLQLRRGNLTPDGDGESDLDRAQKNLRRALAIDDGYMPAYAELTAYYLERAKRDGARGEALDLAYLVATQALRRAPRSVELHNVLGLVAFEVGDPSRAARAFGEARNLDPKFFEAQVNYAAVNLSFRGFAEAESAYRAALKLRPKDYDATLGLAVALRGQADQQDDKVAEAELLLERAKTLAPDRPEAYFNHAILTQTVAGRAADPKSALERSIELYEAFVARANGKPGFADALVDVTAVPSRTDDECLRPPHRGTPECRRGRLHDLRETLEFTALTAPERAAATQDAQTRAAIEVATESP